MVLVVQADKGRIERERREAKEKAAREAAERKKAAEDAARSVSMRSTSGEAELVDDGLIAVMVPLDLSGVRRRVPSSGRSRRGRTHAASW
jgi:hypothetical protein